MLLIGLSLWTARLPIFWMVRILGKRRGPFGSAQVPGNYCGLSEVEAQGGQVVVQESEVGH